MIYSHLATYTGIHLSQQAGRHLYKRNPSHIGGCHKASQITYYTATQGKNRRFSVHTCFNTFGKQLLCHIHGFGAFTSWNLIYFHLQACLLQQILQPLSVDRPHIGICNNQSLARKTCLLTKIPYLLLQPITNIYIIAVLSQLYRYNSHFQPIFPVNPVFPLSDLDFSLPLPPCLYQLAWKHKHHSPDGKPHPHSPHQPRQSS